jgi:hypothetical protein
MRARQFDRTLKKNDSSSEAQDAPSVRAQRVDRRGAAARAAGKKLATPATTRKTAVAATIVTASNGLTP